MTQASLPPTISFPFESRLLQAVLGHFDHDFPVTVYLLRPFPRQLEPELVTGLWSSDLIDLKTGMHLSFSYLSMISLSVPFSVLSAPSNVIFFCFLMSVFLAYFHHSASVHLSCHYYSR